MPQVDVSLTATAYAILGLLRGRPMHGYEIAQHFKPEADLGQVVPADMSTIYTFLKDLQEHGLIRGERETVGARPPRTVFSLTPEAESLFLEWLCRPVARMREVRMDFLLKLYFARQLGATEAKALIKAQTATCRDYLERQRASARDLDTASFESLVLESKLTAAESILDWLNRIASRATPRKQSRVRADKRPARGRRARQ
ncbi:MAG TPA: helix-turn-helix transcriptional regulator [Candidatus Binatia bacterium]|jgi:DNA-binding PadR family transcriptional regulator|nr:helix-turn-helix transcriptional regulator [Candidatus Binatia bacterium]